MGNTDEYFNFVSLLGLQDIAVLRIMFGTSFSVIDLICYAIIQKTACFEKSYFYINNCYAAFVLNAIILV